MARRPRASGARSRRLPWALATGWLLLHCADGPEGSAPDAEDAARPTDGASGAPDAEIAPDAEGVGLDTSGLDDVGGADAEPSDLDSPDTGVPDEGWSFGVLGLNLHCLRLDGTAYATNEARFQAVAALVAAEDVAVILAQEVCERSGTSTRQLLTRALETATSTTWSSHWVYAHEAWTGTPDAAQEGLAVFVRGALESPTFVGYRRQGALQRVLVGARLPSSLGGLQVYSVHLDHAQAAVRAAQSAETASYALTRADPSLDILVAGDFNDVVGSETYRMMASMGFVDLSADLSPGRIDHLWLHRGAGARAITQRLAFDGLSEPRVSDHPGVLVTVAEAAAPMIRPTRFLAEGSWSGYLSVRGDTPPLSWDRGWLAWPLGGGRWKLVLTELEAATFEYKWLLNDVAFQEGENLTGRGGEDHESAPEFP